MILHILQERTLRDRGSTVGRFAIGHLRWMALTDDGGSMPFGASHSGVCDHVHRAARASRARRR